MSALAILAFALSSAHATKIGVRTARCPLGGGPVRIYDQVSVDTFGGFDSDLARYSGQGQYREYSVSTCADNLFSLLGADMDGLPLDDALQARLVARLAKARAAAPAADQLQPWDRYRIAAEMYRELGRDPVFLGDLLLRASWTARDRAVGIYEGLEGPQPARALLDAGGHELSKPLTPHQRKIVAHNLARVAHRGGWAAERDRFLDVFETAGELTDRERTVLAEFRNIVTNVEPALQREAMAAYAVGRKLPGLAPADRSRVTYLLADLHRRQGETDDAVALFDQVIADRSAPADLKQMAAFLSADLKAGGQRR